LARLFASGRIVDLVIAFMAVEAMVLIIVRKYSLRGIPTGDLLISLAAGLPLLLALRAALTGSAWPSIAACLCVALVAHAADLLRRWPPKRQPL
jgi:hypothetical protein